MIRSGLFIIIQSLIVIGSLTVRAGGRIVVDKDIQLILLRDSVYVHMTWHQLEPVGRFSSNGLIMIRNGKALMVDTPMDNDKTERLTRFLKDSLSADLAKLIIGHFHDDCLGGLGFIQSIGIESIAHSSTIKKCREVGLPVPSTPFKDSLIFDFQGEPVECRFFGPGHSFDNITVWIPGEKILFGGCLIRSADSKGLGNLSDAVVAEWDLTVKKLMKRVPDVKTVVPGHGGPGGVELLTHTIELVENEKSKRE
jgi:metallo-beta-lactamase class B